MAFIKRYYCVSIALLLLSQSSWLTAICFGGEILTCFHSDMSGNIVAVTDSTGAPVAKYVYSPYGTVLASAGTATTPFKFSGSFGVMEDIPDIYFMRARYYSVDACRFLSTDPVKSIGPGWKPNLYYYANNNTYSYSDPKGEIFTELLILYGFADLAYQVGFDIATSNYQELNWDLSKKGAIEYLKVISPAFKRVGNPLLSIALYANDFKNQDESTLTGALSYAPTRYGMAPITSKTTIWDGEDDTMIERPTTMPIHTSAKQNIKENVTKNADLIASQKLSSRKSVDAINHSEKANATVQNKTYENDWLPQKDTPKNNFTGSKGNICKSMKYDVGNVWNKFKSRF